MGLADVPTLPVELIVEGRRALIVGVSEECVKKIDRLLGSGADVVVVSPDAPAEVEALAAAGTITWHRRDFATADLEGVAVCFVGPEYEDLGSTLAARARKDGTLVCTLDRPEHATFVNPAVVRAGSLRLTLASGGVAPAVVRALRLHLERALGTPQLQAFVAAVAQKRARLPRGERAAEGRKLVDGFSISISFAWPEWFDRR